MWGGEQGSCAAPNDEPDANGRRAHGLRLKDVFVSLVLQKDLE